MTWYELTSGLRDVRAGRVPVDGVLMRLAQMEYVTGSQADAAGVVLTERGRDLLRRVETDSADLDRRLERMSRTFDATLGLNSIGNHAPTPLPPPVQYAYTQADVCPLHGPNCDTWPHLVKQRNGDSDVYAGGMPLAQTIAEGDPWHTVVHWSGQSMRQHAETPGHVYCYVRPFVTADQRRATLVVYLKMIEKRSEPR